MTAKQLPHLTPDQLGMLCGMAGSVINVWRVPAASAVWLVSNAAWLAWGIKRRAWTVVAMYTFFIIWNTAAVIIRWHNP